MSPSRKSPRDYSRKYQRAILKPWRQSHGLPPSPPFSPPTMTTPSPPISSFEWNFVKVKNVRERELLEIGGEGVVIVGGEEVLCCYISITCDDRDAHIEHLQKSRHLSRGFIFVGYEMKLWLFGENVNEMRYVEGCRGGDAKEHIGFTSRQ
nr:hypothetical protein [Tanacetum cinerariifolium]